VLDACRTFGSVEALAGVSLSIRPGEVHALLGPNGAGKTTLLRLFTGLLTPSAGTVTVAGLDPGRDARRTRSLIGLVPAGERTLYLRLTGLQNLVFFGRMHGLRRREAIARAEEALAAVGLSDAAGRMAGLYSHGMQKRLSFARALLSDPELLLVDEATHDLDPVAAQQVRDLAAERAAGGTAVLWATQRIEELHAFAQRVTVLDRGRVAFAGSVAALTAMGGVGRHMLELCPATTVPLAVLGAALGSHGVLQPAQDGSHVLLVLAPGVALGAAIAVLTEAGAEIVSCRDERPPIERAFLAVTGERAA
jgi:ABC-type multidrug transport system ATPase subunit